MRVLSLYSIKAKLIGMMMAISGVAVVLACLIYAVYDQVQMRSGMARDLSILAEVIGNRSAVALQFDDQRVAEQNLAALSANRSIVAASIHRPDGSVFATYVRPGEQADFSPVPWAAARSYFAGDFLYVRVPILVDEEKLGMVHFQSGLTEINKRMWLLIQIVIGIMAVSLCAAYFLAVRLQRLFSRPIMHLIETAKDISEKKDYSIRAHAHGEDELGVLVDSFNEMLAQIQSQEIALRHSEMKYRSIYENASDGIFQTAPGGRLLTANPAMARILGYDSVEELIAHFTDISRHGYVSAEDLARLRRMFRENQQFSNFDIPIHKKNGELIHVSMAAQHVYDDTGRLLYYEGSLIDVTERKEKERTQRELYEAEQASKAKSEFLAIMSHEIRTPMNVIMGMAHLALQTGLNAKQQNYVEKIEKAAKGLLGIINDILDFSKIEAGKVVFERIEFQLEEVMENLSDLAVIRSQDKGLELLFDVPHDLPAALVGDPVRLTQVLTNLVNNAIKFTDHGEVRVSIRLLDQDEHGVCLRFAVSDTGVGLSVEECSHLFEPFTQADSSTTRKYGGTGLGLTISKRLVELMHGELGVDSQPGVGSTFFFTARFGVQAGHKHHHPVPRSFRGLSVLVVDDNDCAREISVAQLQALGLKVSSVADGEAALSDVEKAQRQGKPYALILMDWHMPGMDGVEAIRCIRAHALSAAGPKCLMVTAYSREELLQRIQEAQIEVDGVLTKPINPSLLCDSIMNALGQEGVRRRRRKKRIASYREAEQSLRGARVLLVEDNEMNQELALEMLQAAGMWVEVAADGIQALKKMEEANYDAVLMDCLMPVMDGFETTRRLRADERFKELPIIAMTANAMVGDRQKCLACGMNDHIAKPIEIGQLFTTLARWIKPDSSRQVPPASGALSLPACLPHLRRVDAAAAVARLGGNVALYCRTLSHFRTDQRDCLKGIRQALNQEDREDLVRLLHTLKGLASSLGAESLARALANMEVAERNGHPDRQAQLLEEVERELLALFEEIDQNFAPGVMRADECLAGAGKPDDQELSVLLPRLSCLLAADDLEATALADPLRIILQGSPAAETAFHLSQLIKRLAFSEAQTLLKKLATELGILIE